MSRLKDLTGQRFGRLIVIQRIPSCGIDTYWLCACDCGQNSEVNAHNLNSGNSTSCGCLHREKAREQNTTHGLTYTPEYNTWRGMVDRCTNPNHSSYARYGGRGITIDPSWRSFEQFYADMGPRPSGFTIERHDNDKSYSAQNCYWATPTIQARNRRPRYNGLCKRGHPLKVRPSGRRVCSICHNRQRQNKNATAQHTGSITEPTTI